MSQSTLLRRATRAAIALVAIAAFAPAYANDPAKGKEKFTQVCASCHGADGNTPIDPSYPKLAGQYPDYLRQALKDYKTGARKNAIMSGIAKGLTTDDIDNISNYLANQKGSLHVRHSSESYIFRP